MTLRGSDAWKGDAEIAGHGRRCRAGVAEESWRGDGALARAARRWHRVRLAGGVFGAVLLACLVLLGATGGGRRGVGRGMLLLLQDSSRGVDSVEGQPESAAERPAPYTWLDSFAMGAGVEPRQGRVGAVSSRLRAGETPPQHAGTWVFSRDGPTFAAATHVPRGQMMDVLPLNVADSEASEATHGAMDWQARVVQYYKKEMAAGRIKEMPPLPSASGHHKKEDYDAFFNGWNPGVAARKELQDASAKGAEMPAKDKAEEDKEQDVSDRGAGEEEAEEEGGGDAQSPRPQTEVTPAEHEDTWSFDPLQGPQPHKRSEQHPYHNPSRFSDSGWLDGIFGSSASPPAAARKPQAAASQSPAQRSRYSEAPPPAARADSNANLWMSALCSAGIISVIVVYVSLDYHVDDIDVP